MGGAARKLFRFGARSRNTAMPRISKSAFESGRLRKNWHCRTDSGKCWHCFANLCAKISASHGQTSMHFVQIDVNQRNFVQFGANSEQIVARSRVSQTI